ncbi:hypothetical protein BN1723_006196 [Verticillium longisporum]|uniref:Uncharacterized protein n=1 Tax=Verticillium longisporum TaxID=100787 RepID=A0A0G4NDN5_VERLO|nr:hypothetical protein BN1723_006196 [Verticillium longisporum]
MSRALARCHEDRGMMLDLRAGATKPPNHGVTESQPVTPPRGGQWRTICGRLGCSTPSAAASMDNVPDRKMRFCSVPLVPSDGPAFICWLAATRTTTQADLRIDQAGHLQAVYRKERGSRRRRRRQELLWDKNGYSQAFMVLQAKLSLGAFAEGDRLTA